eukprot:353033-Chlamydomonas_euryale.AAC.12
MHRASSHSSAYVQRSSDASASSSVAAILKQQGFKYKISVAQSMQSQACKHFNLDCDSLKLQCPGFGIHAKRLSQTAANCSCQASAGQATIGPWSHSCHGHTVAKRALDRPQLGHVAKRALDRPQSGHGHTVTIFWQLGGCGRSRLMKSWRLKPGQQVSGCCSPSAWNDKRPVAAAAVLVTSHNGAPGWGVDSRRLGSRLQFCCCCAGNDDQQASQPLQHWLVAACKAFAASVRRTLHAASYTGMLELSPLLVSLWLCGVPRALECGTAIRDPA